MTSDGEHGKITMRRKESLDLTSIRIHECLDSGPLVGCVSLMFALLKKMQHTLTGDTHKKYCQRTSGTKRGIILRLSLRDNANSSCLGSICTG